MKYKELANRLYKQWIDHFEIIKEGDQTFRCCKRINDQDVVCYDCPCGDDHYAMRFYYEEGFEKTLSEVLNCFENNKQWLIKKPNVAEIIRKEEEAYLKLLEESKSIIEKITMKMGKSKETLHFLWDTHGIHKDITEDIWDTMGMKYGKV